MHYQLLVELLNANETAKYSECFYNAIKSLGFDSAVYGFLPSHEFFMTNNQQPIIIATKCAPLDYLEHYRKNQLFLPENDIFVAKIIEGFAKPMNWWKDIHTFSPSKAQLQTLIEARESFSLTSGLVIPLMSDHRGHACVTLYSQLDDSAFCRLVTEISEQAVLYAKTLHSKIFSDPELVSELYQNYLKINDTERSVLRYLVSGKPMKQIEDHTGISYRYACKVLDTFRKKHGNVPKDELLYSLGHFFS